MINEDDEALQQYVRVQDVADAMMWVVMETVAVLVPDTAKADVLLEDIASRLLETAQNLPAYSGRAIIQATAQNLIQTEAGTG